MSRWLSFTLFFLLLLAPLSASASTVDLHPVRVHLSPKRGSQTIQVRNRSPEAVRYQVTPHRWHQTSSGSMELRPTKDLVVYPSLLEIDPKSSRRIKVATLVSATTVEKAYRLVLEPLPMGPPRQDGTVRLLTRLNMPVFVQPAQAAPLPRVALQLEGGRLRVVVTNAGSSYFVARSVQLTGLSSAGQTVVNEILDGWYVLAGGERQYTRELNPQACAALSSIRAVLRTADDVVRSEIAVDARCGD